MLYSLINAVDDFLALQDSFVSGHRKKSESQHSSKHYGYPYINLYQKDDELILTAEAPGVNKADIALEVKGKQFKISGKRINNYGEKAKAIHVERNQMEFDRTITLPYEIDKDNVNAEYKDGVLTVKMLKSEDEAIQKIEIS